MRTCLWLLLLAAICSSCTHRVVAPYTGDQLYHECHQGNFIDPSCFYAKADIYCNGPRGGLVMRQDVGSTSNLFYLNPMNGRTAIIKSDVWRNAAPVWVPNHPVVSYDTGGPWGEVMSAWTDNTFATGVAFAYEMPRAELSNPMYGLTADVFSFFFRWTGDYGDTNKVVIGWDNNPITLGGYGNPSSARMSINGQWITCLSTTTPGVFLINVASHQITRLTNIAAADPSLSPDGRQIAFIETKTDSSSIWLNNLIRADLGADGTLGQRDTLAHFGPSVAGASPVFSPNGHELAWIFYPPGGYPETLHITDLASHTDRRYTLPGQYNYYAHLDWR